MYDNLRNFYTNNIIRDIYKLIIKINNKIYISILNYAYVLKFSGIINKTFGKSKISFIHINILVEKIYDSHFSELEMIFYSVVHSNYHCLYYANIKRSKHYIKNILIFDMGLNKIYIPCHRLY